MRSAHYPRPRGREMTRSARDETGSAGWGLAPFPSGWPAGKGGEHHYEQEQN